jgi:hypothetical protein
LWSNAVNMHDINSRHLDIKTIIMKIAEKIRSNKPRKYIHTVWRRAAAVPRLWASQSCALGISSPFCHSLQVHTIQWQHFAYSHNISCITYVLFQLYVCRSWSPAEEDKLVFFPTTRTQKRYPIIVKRRVQSNSFM